MSAIERIVRAFPEVFKLETEYGKAKLTQIVIFCFRHYRKAVGREWRLTLIKKQGLFISFKNPVSR